MGILDQAGTKISWEPGFIRAFQVPTKAMRVDLVLGQEGTEICSQVGAHFTLFLP